MAGGFKLPPGLLALMSVDEGGEMVEDTEREVRKPERNSHEKRDCLYQN